MGMKKFLLGLVGIVCALFTLPSWGACYDYTSATGTASQIGTPTPDNPIYPTFYKQGDMVLRKVGNIADTYDATTGKITRRVGEYTFTGRENISMQYNVYGITDIPYDMDKVIDASLCSHNKTYVNTVVTVDRTFDKFLFFTNVNMVGFGVNDTPSEITDTTTFKQWLAAQYAAGTPVKIYYPLETEVVEDWAATTYCPGCDGTVVNYTSATGTVSQNGTPTPTNPIDPVFYTQGNMVLRKVGDYADTYDATTGKITRKVGVKVFDGTEDWGYNSSTHVLALQIRYTTPEKHNNFMITHFTKGGTLASNWGNCYSSNGYLGLSNANDVMTSLDQFKQWLASQYANGTPVTIYYPLETETTEDWPASYCETPIKIASTKYVETEFSALNTALANAVATVNTVVTQTIAQAASIATLQSGKQTRPDETCPAGKKCLLVTDENNIPHWYEIVEPLLPAGYIQLQWIESTGTQYIDTGIKPSTTSFAYDVSFSPVNGGSAIIGNQRNDILVYLNYSNTLEIYHNGTEHTYLATGLQTNIFYNVQVSYNNSSYTATFDGSRQITGTNVNITPNYNWLLFANTNSGTATDRGNLKMSVAKIWNNGELVCNFVPARRNSDNAIGMYDTVGERFYENAGSGSFIAGPAAE